VVVVCDGRATLSMEDSVSYTGQYHLNGEKFDVWGGDGRSGPMSPRRGRWVGGLALVLHEFPCTVPILIVTAFWPAVSLPEQVGAVTDVSL
jgi:hypothetical protein